ncbi:MAG: tetratricopeptide repeat protein [Candidatus Omnitrophica bacterium]|nr:tetratricopeptide repeat protein [Candidatus Omnitrophota bacterium]
MKRAILVFIFILSFTTLAVAASKESHVKKGNALYEKGQYDKSLPSYEKALAKDPESPIINFDLGTALYKNQKYDDAIPYLQKGLLSDDPVVKSKAQFNLGNALYQRGKELGEKNVDQAISSLEESLRQFASIMNVDDKDKDAQYNHAIVEKELDRLRKLKEEKKNNPSNKNQENQEKQDKQDQQKNKEQNNESSNASDKDSGQQKDDQSKQARIPKDQGSMDNSNDENYKNDENEPDPAAGEMTKDEAKQLLKHFEQSEGPTRLLNFGNQKSQDRPTLKDW